MRTLRILPLITLLVGVVSAPVAAGSAKSEIDAALEVFASAFNNGDAATIAGLYTTNAVLLPPGAKRAEGRKNIEAFWKGGIDAGLKNLVIQIGSVEELGDTAIEVSRFSLDVPGEGGAMTKSMGKYIVIWKKEDGKWRLHYDIWNSDPAK